MARPDEQTTAIRFLEYSGPGGVDQDLRIAVLDPPGPGGASHHYAVQCPKQHWAQYVNFQKGPVLEAGPNGLTVESLLAICIDRLECFQAGPYPCGENANALLDLRRALLMLNARTGDRLMRGVEGTSKP